MPGSSRSRAKSCAASRMARSSSVSCSSSRNGSSQTKRAEGGAEGEALPGGRIGAFMGSSQGRAGLVARCRGANLNPCRPASNATGDAPPSRQALPSTVSQNSAESGAISVETSTEAAIMPISVL